MLVKQEEGKIRKDGVKRRGKLCLRGGLRSAIALYRLLRLVSLNSPYSYYVLCLRYVYIYTFQYE
jgi:hypothetical protein